MFIKLYPGLITEIIKQRSLRNLIRDSFSLINVETYMYINYKDDNVNENNGK